MVAACAPQGFDDCTTGFDDCTTVFAAFKLIESFDGLLERDMLQTDLRRNESEVTKRPHDWPS
eukprot:6394386-Prymnesium_polylepis.1